MLEEKELRIGISSESLDFYRGQFAGEVVDLDPEMPWRLVITETVVYERVNGNGPDSRRISILQNRPHLLLRTSNSGDWRTILAMVSLSASTNHTNAHVRIGQVISPIHSHQKEWQDPTDRPSADDILESIPGIVLEGGVAKFSEWYKRMTPPGWKMPKLISPLR